MSPILGIIASGANVATGSFESIASVTAAGGETSLSFTSIPSTYQHLQIRGIGRNQLGGISQGILYIRLNSDTGTNYTRHFLSGDGATASAGGGTNFTYLYAFSGITTDGAAANVFGVSIINFHDYASTSKYKTVRMLSGANNNDTETSHQIMLNSGLWLSTNAITSIELLPGGNTFKAGSTFALYGVKGA